MEIIVNNNVQLQDLHNNKTWIHGHRHRINHQSIDITLFLITIRGSQLKYTLDAINALPKDIPFYVNVVMDVCPTVKAYNEMRLRCKTDYFVQLDEDMVLFPNAIQMLNQLIYTKSKKHNQCFLHSFYLVDEYLGIGPNKLLEGLKLYNFRIMKDFPTATDVDVTRSSVDRIWHKKIEAAGFIQMNHYDGAIGYHAKYRTPFDLMIRYCKSTQSFLNPDIKKNSGDICRLIKCYQKLPCHINQLFDMMVQYLIYRDPNRFSIPIFNKNYVLFHPLANKYISNDTLASYDLPPVRIELPQQYTIQSNPSLFDPLCTMSMYHIFDFISVLGIITVLFEQYQYSFTHYPHDIYRWFMALFRFQLCIVGNEEKIIHLFEKYDCITFVSDQDDPLNDCIISVENENVILDGQEFKITDDVSLIKAVLDRPRKRKY